MLPPVGDDLTVTAHAIYRTLAATAPHAAHVASRGLGGLVWLLLLVVAGVAIWAGRQWGRRAALKHLGTAEFRARWATINRIRKW